MKNFEKKKNASKFIQNATLASVIDSLFHAVEKSGEFFSTQFLNVSEVVFSKGTTEVIKSATNVAGKLLKNLLTFTRKLLE